MQSPPLELCSELGRVDGIEVGMPLVARLEVGKVEEISLVSTFFESLVLGSAFGAPLDSKLGKVDGRRRSLWKIRHPKLIPCDGCQPFQIQRFCCFCNFRCRLSVTVITRDSEDFAAVSASSS